VIGGGFYLVSNYVSGRDFNWSDFAIATASGAVSGAVAGATGGASLLAQAASGAAAGAAGGAVYGGATSYAAGGSLQQVAGNALSGAAVGAVAGLAGGAVTGRLLGANPAAAVLGQRVTANAAGGATAGAIGGGFDGYMHTGTLAGTLEGAATGLVYGGVVAGGLTAAGAGVRRAFAPRGGRYLDPKSVSDFTLAERLDLRTTHQSLINLLERGRDVSMPSGAASSKLMGEITAATGREVGLIRVGGKRVLRMGTIDEIDMSDASRVIAHTHPSGDLRFSGVLGGGDGDIPMFRLNQPKQRSSGLIAPDGTFIRLPIPRR
jgi:hypothetical protein